MSWLSKAGRDPKILSLLGIMGVGAYLRLWNIQHLFNAVHDYDEGCLSLGARFISQGYLPYQDFMLVHPPLYNFVLASVYKIFGYSFFSGRYLSIALSLACIVIIYFIGKKLYHPTAGIVAAALFAVSPDMVYAGRRPVQETLGIFLILLAIYFALDFIQNGKRNKAFFCGLLLGLAVATKVTFIPAVVAIIGAIILLTMGERFWQSLKTLGRPAFWVMYLGFAAMSYSLLLILRWSLKLDVSIPFVTPMPRSVDNVAVAVLVLFLPFVLSIALLERNLPFKRWWSGLWELRHNRGLWLLLGGTALGFICITGFFWVKMPQEFISQTTLLHMSRTYFEFPSLVGIIRVVLTSASFLKMAFLPILLAIPVIFVLLNKRNFSKSDCFLSATLIFSLVVCQGFFHVSRYYVSIFPFLFLGIAGLMPPLDAKMLTTELGGLTTRLKASLLAVLAIFLFFISVTVVLLTNYTGYDINQPWFASDEEHVYSETIDYLEGAGAKKIYAVNPIFPALAPNLNSTLAFESFAMLFLAEKPPEEIIKERIDEGVDYVVLDSFIRYWDYPFLVTAMELVQEVRSNGRLMMVIEPDSPIRTEIYLLGAETQGVFNGDFAHWVKKGERQLPLGWQPLLITGENDKAIIEEGHVDSKSCLALKIYEDGLSTDTTDATNAAVFQNIPFPETELKVEVFPTVNTVTTGRVIIGSGIHFVDDHGHVIGIGFSDEVDEEKAFLYGDGNRMLVVKNAQLNQWSEHFIDLSDYWSRTDWWQPEEIRIYLVTSTYYTEPGYYDFYVAKIEIEDNKSGATGE